MNALCSSRDRPTQGHYAGSICFVGAGLGSHAATVAGRRRGYHREMCAQRTPFDDNAAAGEAQSHRAADIPQISAVPSVQDGQEKKRLDARLPPGLAPERKHSSRWEKRRTELRRKQRSRTLVRMFVHAFPRILKRRPQSSRDQVSQNGNEALNASPMQTGSDNVPPQHGLSKSETQDATRLTESEQREEVGRLRKKDQDRPLNKTRLKVPFTDREIELGYKRLPFLKRKSSDLRPCEEEDEDNRGELTEREWGGLSIFDRWMARCESYLSDDDESDQAGHSRQPRKRVKSRGKPTEALREIRLRRSSKVDRSSGSTTSTHVENGVSSPSEEQLHTADLRPDEARPALEAEEKQKALLASEETRKKESSASESHTSRRKRAMSTLRRWAGEELDGKKAEAEKVERGRNVPFALLFGNGISSDKDLTKIKKIFGPDTFFASQTVLRSDGVLFRGNLRGDPTKSRLKMEQRLSEACGDKFTLCLIEDELDGRPAVLVMNTWRNLLPVPGRNINVIWASFLVLGAQWVRFNELYVSNYFLYGRPYGISAARARGPFPASEFQMLLLILMLICVREVAQRVAARRHGVRVGLSILSPSFSEIPISSHTDSPAASRNVMCDIVGVGAGSMLLASLALFVVGMYMTLNPTFAIRMPVIQAQRSMLIGVGLGRVFRNRVLQSLDGALFGLHPLAMGGMYGMLLCAVNLIPLPQLDGGRLVRALYGRRTSLWINRVTWTAVVLSALWSNFKSISGFVMLVGLLVTPFVHDTPCQDELTPPDAKRTLGSMLLLAIGFAILIPVPRALRPLL
ncbi:putative zinc metalloprotease EGY3, chloroplastic [Porphyridium purpureum]|uniref:Putative zinc metalloprotease EGY3, chloroplastic n=1 Tax=Porphyridium purpureum TaxID=35688 RepID=A0A5J4YID8_PORPP|nr:putative zinc metalloprotease EGY3, chloroplastic [Porphyridium purpureum]|eukprot:POR6192..scf251_18